MVSLGMMTRLESHIEKSRKVSGPRSLQCSHWGFICPVDTPDGENCGLVKNLSLLARVSTNVDDALVKAYLLGLGVVETGVFNIWEMDAHLSNWFLVILNGRIIGGVPEHFELVPKLKELRARRKIHYSVSICCDMKDRVIDICTDGCRLMRPLLNLRNMVKANLDLQKEIYSSIKTVLAFLDGLNSEELNSQGDSDALNNTLSIQLGYISKNIFESELSSDRTASILQEALRKPESSSNPLSLMKPQVVSRFKVLVSDTLMNWLLAENIIEYLDVNEMNNCMISLDLNRVNSQTTHIEISYDSILGVIAGSTIPFPHHNQSPRNTYQCAIGKQSLGITAHNFGDRMDTVRYQMTYPQKPIVSTEIAKLTGFEKFPAGHNACIAVMSYSGYDIEDAIVINKSSIEKGFGRSIVSRKYSVDLNKQYFQMGRLTFIFYFFAKRKVINRKSKQVPTKKSLCKPKLKKTELWMLVKNSKKRIF
jgi:DNA-directed RNA polymerase III subunit RPC2